MTWFVKSESPDGKIASILKDDFEQAFELRNEFLAKGIKAWMEDTDGRLVGYTVTKDAPIKG